MQRRDFFKTMIMAGIAPAFIVQGLMKVKPIRKANKMEIGYYGGFRWYETEDIGLTVKTLNEAKKLLEKNKIPKPYKAYFHPITYNDIKNADLLESVEGVEIVSSSYIR